MKSGTRARRCVVGAAAAALLTTTTLLVATGGVRAQSPAVPTKPADSAMSMANTLPSSVLLFPAVIPSDAPAASTTSTQASANAPRPVAEGIVTDALRRFLERGGIGVVVYNRRLPAIERAVSEGMRPEDALRGPGDDPRKAKTFADLLAANEYLSVIIDDYKYDSRTRTATFNLSVTRSAADGSNLAATSLKAVGSAPENISPSRQEAFAVSSAAEVVAQQTVEAAYPGAAARINPPKAPQKKKRKGVGNILIPAAAVGAAIIAGNTE